MGRAGHLPLAIVLQLTSTVISLHGRHIRTYKRDYGEPQLCGPVVWGVNYRVLTFDEVSDEAQSTFGTKMKPKITWYSVEVL